MEDFPALQFLGTAKSCSLLPHSITLCLACLLKTTADSDVETHAIKSAPPKWKSTHLIKTRSWSQCLNAVLIFPSWLHSSSENQKSAVNSSPSIANNTKTQQETLSALRIDVVAVQLICACYELNVAMHICALWMYG